MSMQDTIALIDRYYAAFNRGDWNAMLECLTDDVVARLEPGSARERPRRVPRVSRAHGQELLGAVARYRRAE